MRGDLGAGGWQERVVRPAPQDSKVDNWVRWITGPIRADVLNIHHRQAVYRRVGEIVSTRRPPLPESLFFSFIRETYATSQLAAVRRQAEASTRVLRRADPLLLLSGSRGGSPAERGSSW